MDMVVTLLHCGKFQFIIRGQAQALLPWPFRSLFASIFGCDIMIRSKRFWAGTVFTVLCLVVTGLALRARQIAVQRERAAVEELRVSREQLRIADDRLKRMENAIKKSLEATARQFDDTSKFITESLERAKSDGEEIEQALQRIDAEWKLLMKQVEAQERTGNEGT